LVNLKIFKGKSHIEKRSNSCSVVLLECRSAIFDFRSIFGCRKIDCRIFRSRDGGWSFAQRPENRY
jgi:hypothetical protein